MLPTRPRVAERSMCSSWTTPASRTATRVSWGVMLIRISSVTKPERLKHADSGPRQQSRRFGQRKTDHPRIAAFELLDENGSPPLDRIGTGLVERFVACAVALDLLVADRAHRDVRDR